MRRRTVKRARSSEYATVEGLRASFDKLESKVRAQIARGATDRQLGACVRKEWEALFHTTISEPAVRGMVMQYRAVHGSKRVTRKQRGGMAPMDWTMGQGTTAAVYGRFPVEIGATPSVVKSLDRFYENPIGRACDSTGGYPAPKQAGGSVWDGILLADAPRSIPVNGVQEVVATLAGRPSIAPSASPVAATVPLAQANPTPYDPSAIADLKGLAPIYQGY
jgi:hypothetical protein